MWQLKFVILLISFKLIYTRLNNNMKIFYPQIKNLLLKFLLKVLLIVRSKVIIVVNIIFI